MAMPANVLGWDLRIDETIRAISPIAKDAKSFEIIYDDDKRIIIKGESGEVSSARSGLVETWEYVTMTEDQDIDDGESEGEEV